MSWLIVPVSVILLRGAIAVLILAGAEALAEDYLSARVRRALWCMCIFLMMMPHPQLPTQIFTIDFTEYREFIINIANILPESIAQMFNDAEIAHKINHYSLEITGLSYQNYPYLIAMLLAIIPALFILIKSYFKCRGKTEKFKEVADERILKIYAKVCGNAKSRPKLLDSAAEKHPPVLFGFFRQKMLLPVKALSALSDEEIELLLAHEFEHYRSFDGIINILTLCLWPFCWYNPFFLAARKHLRINCELACDVRVLKKYPGKNAEYGKLLLSFADTAKPPEVTMAFREYSGELKRYPHFVSLIS